MCATGKMTKKEQQEKLWNDFLFFTVWLVALIAFCFMQANTLKKFMEERDRFREVVEICVEPTC